MATYVYDDFRVTFTPRADDTFDMRAVDAAGTSTTSRFTLPLSTDELEQQVLRFARGRASRRASALVARDVGGDEAPVVIDAERLGASLADALFGGDVGDAYEHARHRAESNERGLRLTLSLAAAPHLLSVPWEFLYRRPRFLASQRRTPLVRLLDAGSLAAPPLIDGEVRILGIVASPHDLPALDVDAERRRVEQAVAAVADLGRVRLDWLEPATPRRLRQALRDGNYHVVHYVGHSAFTDDGSGLLYLEDGKGGSIEVDETLFANLLADQDLLRLVVLNSCEGARTTLTDPFAGVATTLIHLGVPAVVAMQFEISDEAAILFAEELYTNLIGRQDPIDAAVAEARKAIYSEIDKVEFATPVLFVRDPDVELFRFEVDKAELPPPPPPDRRLTTTPPTPADAELTTSTTTTNGSPFLRPVLIAVAAIVAALAVWLVVRAILDDGPDDGSTTATTSTTSTTTTTTVPVVVVAWPSVRVGAEGPTVEVLQRLLTVQGHPVEPTGFFDDATLEAVEALEDAANIPVDGEVGRVTWQQLVEPVRRGDTGEAVLAAELLLAENGVDIEPDDRFTLATQDAVMRFQGQHQLAVDGIVDADTWEALLSGAQG
ncbi:MAG: CHAT domain-containing protein [Ilumatobacteraceae bacterium]